MNERNCRDDFPALQVPVDGHPVAYLDNAATTLKPQQVIDALCNFYQENGCTVHRGKHRLSERATVAYETVRRDVAEFIGAIGNEVVFVRNTTEALNLVASGLRLNADDIVVGCLDSHHSQILPWRRHSQLKLVRLDRNMRPDLGHYRDLLRLGPKVVALTHCSNVTGAIAPIAQMASEAKAACNAIVVLDAAQTVPHFRLDVSAMQVDFVAFSGHKMLAPTGVGCLFGKRDLLEGLRPLLVGGGMVDWVDVEGSQDRKIPHRLEAGTPAVSSVIGLGAAIEYLEALGREQQVAHHRALTNALLRCALARDYIELVGPRDPEERAAIASFRIRGCEAISDVAQALSDSYGVMCRSGHMCAQPVVSAIAGDEILRVSAYVYNTVSEIESVFDALDELVPYLSARCAR